MNLDQAITLIQNMLMTALMVGGPVLLVTFAVGLVISIFQAATQINEMTLTFIPKIVATILAMVFFGAWMFTKLSDYFHELFASLMKLLQ
jgi:flagellar biosynthetic protein FliQ